MANCGKCGKCFSEYSSEIEKILREIESKLLCEECMSLFGIKRYRKKAHKEPLKEEIIYKKGGEKEEKER